MTTRLRIWAGLTAALVVLLFGFAGRVDLPLLWAYVAVFSAVSLAGLVRIDVDLIDERRRPGPGGVDRSMRRIVAPIAFVHLVVAALDVGRFHISEIASVGVRTAGLAAFLLSLLLTVAAMAENRFFSPVVRIQAERGHHTVSTRPYRLVRHPGYLGMAGAFLSSGVALGSLWSVVPSAVCIFIILRRTRLEDRFLLTHLDGYAAYASAVRYRLLPGIW